MNVIPSPVDPPTMVMVLHDGIVYLGRHLPVTEDRQYPPVDWLPAWPFTDGPCYYEIATSFRPSDEMKGIVATANGDTAVPGPRHVAFVTENGHCVLASLIEATNPYAYQGVMRFSSFHDTAEQARALNDRTTP